MRDPGNEVDQSGRRQSRLICGGKRVSKYLRCLSPRGMKFQVKVEYGKDKFVKFYVEADVVELFVFFTCGGYQTDLR